MGETPLVMVTWQDSRQAEGKWQWLSAYTPRDVVTVQSVGWLIQDDAEVKVLAQSLAPDGDDVQAAGIKIIAARSVVKIERLAEVDDDEQREAAE